MKKWTIISLVILAVVISGCNLPGYQVEDPQESNDMMATEIARILTGTPVEIEPTATSALTEEETAPAEETEETTPPEETEETVVVPTETPVVEEPTSTPEPTETPTPEPTETPSDTDPAGTLGEPDWLDKMDNGDNWATGYSSFTSIDFDDGFLKLTTETDYDGWRLSWPILEDFYLEAKLQSPKCEGNDHFGLMFRSPEKSDATKGYLFGITCDGQYSLRLWNGSVMDFLIKWTKNDAIKTGANAVNTLGIHAEGTKLILYVNGQKLEEVNDNTYLDGQFGLFVGGINTDGLSVWADQVRYWKIQ